MSIMAMTVALIFLTLGAGCLLWALLLHFEEIHAAAEHEVSHPKRAAFLFLTLAGLITVGTLAVLLVEVQQLFMPPSL
jgi:uncharacterized membrane protein YidH (DUF202 family)